MKISSNILFFSLFIQSLFAFEYSPSSSIYSKDGNVKPYLHYEFGATYSVIVDIIEGVNVCEVYIYDEQGTEIHTTCDKTPLLEWAFNDLTDDLQKVRIETDQDYKLVHYRLSLFDGDGEIVIATSHMQFPRDEEITSKIEQLRSFMLHFWVEDIKKRINQK